MTNPPTPDRVDKLRDIFSANQVSAHLKSLDAIEQYLAGMNFADKITVSEALHLSGKMIRSAYAQLDEQRAVIVSTADGVPVRGGMEVWHNDNSPTGPTWHKVRHWNQHLVTGANCVSDRMMKPSNIYSSKEAALAASGGSDKPMTSREARDKLNARSHEIMRETREGSDE